LGGFAEIGVNPTAVFREQAGQDVHGLIGHLAQLSASSTLKFGSIAKWSTKAQTGTWFSPGGGVSERRETDCAVYRYRDDRSLAAAGQVSHTFLALL
jgi:hypothetical protein